MTADAARPVEGITAVGRDPRVELNPAGPALADGPGTVTAPPHRARVAALDGVRGVAILLVLVGHVLPRLWFVSAAGVTVFFALSGYLITGILLREHARDGRVGLRRFYLRRLFRLGPTLLLVLTATVVWCLATHAYTATLGRDALAVLTYRANVGVADADFTAPLAQTWSLSVEEQFYLVWPILLVVLGARRPRLLMVAATLAVASVLWRVHVAGSSLTGVLYGSCSVAVALLVGCVVACLQARTGPALARRAVPGAAVAVVVAGAACAALHLSTARTLALVLPLVALATAVALPRVPLPRLLSSRLLVWFGGISYALYLWQTPIEYNGLTAFRGGTPPWLVVGLAVPLAWLTTRYLERPLTALGRRLTSG
jgi:peptidoglycan/LPS O-acetylase OafA/YrhL